ncbi:MAG: hypothetical protein WCF90_08565 [Methanomicrobiales archaeon]
MVAPLANASLPYDAMVSYPNDWERGDVLTMGVRGYGQNTVNIAYFHSPNEIAGDPLSYNSFGIYVD